METLLIPGSVLSCQQCLCSSNCPSCPGAQNVRSLAFDAAGNLWFSEGGPDTHPITTTTVGHVTSNWSPIVMMPPLSLYSFTSDGSDCADSGTFVSFNGAGIAVNANTGDVWFADYCRERLEQLHRVS
jgi:hypothetical protein